MGTEPFLKILYPDFVKKTTVGKVKEYTGIGQKAFYFSQWVAKRKNSDKF